MGKSKTAGREGGTCCAGLVRRNFVIAAAGGTVFVLDQITKRFIADWLPHGASETVVDGFFNLVHARNTGIAFSLFAEAAPWFRNIALPAVSLAAVAILVMMLRNEQHAGGMSRIALALVLAGAAGNLTDRWMQGYVTDFLDFYVGAYHWPAFNVADSAITVGVALLLLESVRGGRQVSRSASPT